MIILMKCLNEGPAVDRVMLGIHGEGWVDRIIVIDGGSTDDTVDKLMEWPKCEVYCHPWLDWYHDMEITQSNIALSYVPHGEICFILDFDEMCSSELKALLFEISSGEHQDGWDIAHVSRRTFELMRFPNSPFAMFNHEGDYVTSHQIGEYPDYQCRIIRKSSRLHWVQSPHHQLMGWEVNRNFEADILHFEKEDKRNRERIEIQWAKHLARRKFLGLPCDVFEAHTQPKYARYTDPKHWGWMK